MPIKRPLVLAVLAPLVALAAAVLGACTPAELATAGTVATDVSTVAAGAPVACAVLSATGQTAAGTACGTVATDVSAVSKLIQGILDSLPAAPPAALLPNRVAMGGFTYRGVTVALPTSLAAAVQERLPAS